VIALTWRCRGCGQVWNFFSWHPKPRVDLRSCPDCAPERHKDSIVLGDASDQDGAR